VLRLHHLFSPGESQLATNYSVNLDELFTPPLKLVSCEEQTLSLLQPLTNSTRLHWKVAGSASERSSSRVMQPPSLAVTIRPMETRTFLCNLATSELELAEPL